jgi:hypothetical protein
MSHVFLVVKDLAEKVAVFGSLEAYYDAVQDYWRRKTVETLRGAYG